MSFHKLPSDLFHEILASVPDLPTLSAAIRISKNHYDVFKAHPKSIIRAVLENCTGGAVGPAARLAQWRHQVYLHDTYNVAKTLPGETFYEDSSWTPPGHVVKFLSKQHEATSTLRDFYSQRHKDRSSPTSKLDWDESHRFERAMYRYWLCRDMLERGVFELDMDDFIDDDEDDFDDDAFEERKLEHFISGFKGLLDAFSTDELLEILNVAAFCRATAKWQGQAYYPDVYTHDDADPISLANNFADKRVSGWYDASWEEVQRIIIDILVCRKIKEEDIDSKVSKAIVKEVAGANDLCSRCSRIGGVELIGPANISLLSGILSFNERVALLPGMLFRNRDEWRQLANYIYSDGGKRAVSDADLFKELVDITPDDNDEIDGWSQDGEYCLACIKDLFRKRFMLWWRQTKQKNGMLVPDDCWYGYNCRTMTHRSAHATKLNHLCVPTRGEDPKAPKTATNSQAPN